MFYTKIHSYFYDLSAHKTSDIYSIGSLANYKADLPNRNQRKFQKYGRLRNCHISDQLHIRKQMNEEFSDTKSLLARKSKHCKANVNCLKQFYINIHVFIRCMFCNATAGILIFNSFSPFSVVGNLFNGEMRSITSNQMNSVRQKHQVS
jgi:hypothetical protein